MPYVNIKESQIVNGIAKQVGAVQEVGPVGAENGNGGVAHPIGKDVHGCFDGAGGGWVSGSKGNRPSDKGAARTVAGRGSKVVTRASREGGEGDFRVDDERPLPVVFAERETHVTVCQLILAGHGF